MQDKLLNKTKRNVVLIFLALLIVVGLVVYRSMSFHLVKTNPASGSITTDTPFFKLYFNKPLAKKARVSSSPNVVNSYSVSGKIININFNVPLDTNTNYVLYVNNIYSSTGKHINNLTFYFTPQTVNAKDLPSDQTQALLNNQRQYSQSTYGSGLTQLLPFTEPNGQYKISYTSQGSGYIFIVTAPDPQDKQAALDWIKAQGYNPANLDIQYMEQIP